MLCAVAAILILTACGAPAVDRAGSGGASQPPTVPSSKVLGSPLRGHERFVDLAMPTAYAPKAPTYGTDDYRCFLLDPKLAEPTFVTGMNVLPGRPDIVHHVILFSMGPDKVAEAKAKDAATPGEGWTCFGGTGMSSNPAAGLESAPWLAAWAPGGSEQVFAPDIGIPLETGSRIVMQVHYNLLAGKGPDTSSARLRLAPERTKLKSLRTMLMPAPVELPCRTGKTRPLCDRSAAVLDVIGRFGQETGQTIAGLQLLCGGNFVNPRSGPVQSCDRTIREPGTVRAVAGHMHLLGRSISIVLNPGKRGERTLLDIPVWDFDNQGARPLAKPAHLKPGDVLRVTCHHDQHLRDLLPSFKGQPERYVVWGEGTTDEMCLGIVMLTNP